MQIKTGIGKAIGKIILIGEHSVVYGEPAIAIPFKSIDVKTTINKIDGPVTLDSCFYNGLISHAPDYLLGLTTLVKEIVDSLNQELKNFSINIESQIPPERGLGSSAATAISTVRALYDFFDEDLTTEKLLQWTDISEKIIHGNPSGIDASVISRETSVYYIRDKTFESFPFKTDAFLVVADSGAQTKTKETVMGVKRLVDTRPAQTMALIRQLGMLTNKAKKSLINKDLLELGSTMNEAHEILNELGVSTEKLNLLISIARDSGALGAKLTGGGGGGSIIALAPDKYSARNISETLMQNGAVNTWITSLGS